MEIIENGLSVPERPPDGAGNDAETVVLDFGWRIQTTYLQCCARCGVFARAICNGLVTCLPVFQDFAIICCYDGRPWTLMVGCRNPQRQMVTKPKGQQFQWLSSGESSLGSKPE
jgi:hypothetical protein